jgi:hypothetical protein
MTEETPLLQQTLRVTAFMVVPVAAFLAILSAVALFAVPSASPAAKEQRVILEGEHPGNHTSAAPRAPTRTGARALVRPRGGT